MAGHTINEEVTMAMILQTILPALCVLAFVGFALAGVLWGEDSALPSGMSRDGRAIRWSLRPTNKG
jgi:hypothetical protein